MQRKQWLRLPWRRKSFPPDPEEAVFARLFRRLLLWYISLLAVLVLLLGLGIGTTVPWMVYTSTQHTLSSLTASAAQSWQSSPTAACPLTLPGAGYMAACYDAQGHLLKALGKHSGPEAHFQDNSLALAALRDGTSAQDALDETGTEQVQFDFVFLGSARPGIVRQALVVREAGSKRVLGVIQVGTTVSETLARRGTIVDIFFASMALAILLLVPLGGWYLTGKALLPARLAFKRQKDFIANVSHELRTPLALLRANADVLLRGRRAEEDAALLEDIVAEAVYMDKMTSNMLLLARMDAGQLHTEQEVLDLGEIAERVVRRAQALARQSRITLKFQQEEAVYTLGDTVLLEQVMLILLDNALKYTHPEGKVNVCAFKDPQKRQSCLRVSDTGIGIAPEHLPRLGERFYRVDRARARAVGGHGLGLSIARGIVAAHKGELILTSQPGQGTIATILLPAVHPPRSSERKIV